MQKTLYNRGYNGMLQLAVFVAMWGAGLIVGSLGAAAAWTLMTGQGLMNMQMDMLNPAYAGAIKILQFITTFFVFFLPAVAYALVCWRPPALALGFSASFNWKTALLCVAILFAFAPLIDLLSIVNKAIPLPAATRSFFDRIEESYEQQVKVIGDVKTTGQYILSLIMIAGLPAFFEEVLFRGGMQNLFARWWQKPWVAIVVTAIIFSAIHGSWYGFLPRIALGIMLGVVFSYTRNIWYNVLIHFINNGIIVTYMFISAKRGREADMGNTTFPWWMGVLSIGGIIVLLGWLKSQTATIETEKIVYDRKSPFDPIETGEKH